jgi:hypothetical protein
LRDPDDPVFQAGRAISEVIEGEIAIPNDRPLTQLIWATIWRSKRTFEAISHMLGQEFDTQAAMLARSLFEDMVVAHWLDYNRDDPDWLVDRFFKHRDAMALDQIDVNAQFQFGTGPLIVPDSKELRSKKNALGREFSGRARRDWWDPGSDGRGGGAPKGIRGVAAILEDAAARQERFHPRFAGGQDALLGAFEGVILNWFSKQLHHTAIGLPFQPQPTGPITQHQDPHAAFRVFFTAYWTYGQQVYLLFEHLDRDVTAYDHLFIQGLIQIGAVILPESAMPEALDKIRPMSGTPDDTDPTDCS